MPNRSFRNIQYPLLTTVTVLLITLVIGWAIVKLFAPIPPRTITMITGPQDGVYYKFGKRYQEILAGEGIRLRLLTSNGSVENIERLRDKNSDVSVGFVQGGVSDDKDYPEIESLGTVSYEPLWIFYKAFPKGVRSNNFKGLRISIGPKGSGSRNLLLKLLAMNGITDTNTALLALMPTESADALLKGEIDVSALVASWDSPVVQKLLHSRDIRVYSIQQSSAYVAHLPFLNRLVLPMGVIDFEENYPPSDIELLAPETSLVVRKDLHPAIQYLLLEAAMDIHSEPGIFQKAGEFPSAESIDFPLSEHAIKYYKNGSPFLMQYLPFWMAILVERLLVLLLPLFTIVFPIIRFSPLLFYWWFRHRIFNLYVELRLLEADVNMPESAHTLPELIEQLNTLEAKANGLKVPKSIASMLYTLRHHISLVRDRLQSQQNR